jgi:hypothetical protein
MLLKPSERGVVAPLLGLYLFVHFAQLVPYGAEVFSDRGVLPSASLSPLASLFPNILAVWDTPLFVTYLLVAAAVGSLAFAAGIHRRPVALGLWYVWACLMGRNPLISNPSLPYVGWMLLAFGCCPPRGKGLDASGRSVGRALPAEVYAAAWILLAVGYGYSGLTKLASPSWLDGTAVQRILENPLARSGPLRDALLSFPTGLLKLATWGALALELLFAPLALVPGLRRWLWAAMLMVHVVLLALVSFADLSLGMVMFHLFTFDPAWLAAVPWPPSSRRVPLPSIAGPERQWTHEASA